MLTDADVMQLTATLTAAAIQSTKDFDVSDAADGEAVAEIMEQIHGKLTELNKK